LNLAAVCLFSSGCKQDWSARLGLRQLWRNCLHPFQAYPLDQLKGELSSDPPRFSFAVLGNTDLAGMESARGDERIPLEDIMEGIRSFHPPPDFIFHVGDVAERPGDVAAWEEMRRLAAPFAVGSSGERLDDPPGRPCFVLPGDRDVEDKRTEGEFFERFAPPSGGLPYSFDWEEFHFVALNSESVDDSWMMRFFGFNRLQNRITGTQREWLERDLEANHGKKIVVFIHKPLFPPVLSRYEGYCLDQYYSDREKLLDLFDRHSVRAVFTGHEAVFSWARIADTYYIITGGAGREPKARRRLGGFHHFLYVTVDARSRIKVYCIDPGQDVVRERLEIG
jgi:hypothetical protein